MDIYADEDLQLMEIEDAAARATYSVCDTFTNTEGEDWCWHCNHTQAAHAIS